MSALPIAAGPAMYFGGSIMTFALPYGAFIAAAVVLYFLFRAAHSGPKLKYLSPGHVASLTTREPGPAPVARPSALAAEPETPVPPGAQPEETSAPQPAAPPESAAPETGGGEA